MIVTDPDGNAILSGVSSASLVVDGRRRGMQSRRRLERRILCNNQIIHMWTLEGMENRSWDGKRYRDRYRTRIVIGLASM
jgi:hypothetical protein